MKTTIKVRPLAPAEQEALDAARNIIKPMCDLLRMVPDGWPVATLEPENEADDEGELRRRFFAAEKLFANLPTTTVLTAVPAPALPSGDAPPPKDEESEDPNPAFRKPLFKDNEKMRLGDGYSAEDKKKIKAIMVRIVSSQVAKGEVNADDPESLKKATIEAGKLAKAAYDAAIDFLRG